MPLEQVMVDLRRLTSIKLLPLCGWFESMLIFHTTSRQYIMSRRFDKKYSQLGNLRRFLFFTKTIFSLIYLYVKDKISWEMN
jgi:hypothetical protein